MYPWGSSPPFVMQKSLILAALGSPGTSPATQALWHPQDTGGEGSKAAHPPVCAQ